MEIRERLVKQASLIEDLVKELEIEKSYRGIERLVQLILQALLDLGAMVISAMGGPRPTSYSEIGRILKDAGAIGGEEAETLRSMAGLRNLLVHAYAVVRRERVLEFARRLKVDALKIASSMLKGLERRGVDPPSKADEVVEKIKKVLEGRVVLAYLYGGRAKGYSLKGDYDIAVLLKEPCDLYEIGEIVVEVAEALGVKEEDVDVVCLDALPPEHVLEALDGLPIIDEPRLAFELKVRALLLLLDMEESERFTNLRPAAGKPSI
jgi:uncharacterized protein YutE (UPF0331/DUF86 family)